jgi:ABC-type Fe3+ transport system substrate-binding protein
LLIAWFFSPDAQRVVSDIGMQGTMPDAPKVVGAPAGAIKFHVADWRLLDERYADVVKMYRQIFTN